VGSGEIWEGRNNLNNGVRFGATYVFYCAYIFNGIVLCTYIQQSCDCGRSIEEAMGQEGKLIQGTFILVCQVSDHDIFLKRKLICSFKQCSKKEEEKKRRFSKYF